MKVIMSKNIKKMLGSVEILVQHAKDELNQTIDTKIDTKFAEYKTNFIWKDKWCCEPMKDMAMKIWNLPNPSTRDEQVFTTLNFCGHPVVYCLFCGVKL